MRPVVGRVVDQTAQDPPVEGDVRLGGAGVLPVGAVLHVVTRAPGPSRPARDPPRPLPARTPGLRLSEGNRQQPAGTVLHVNPDVDPTSTLRTPPRNSPPRCRLNPTPEL